MEENIQTPEVDTAPQDQPEGEATAAAGTTQEAETATDTTPEAGEADNVQQPITIPIQYKHEARELTLEEAQDFAQKGLRYDEIAPTLDKLRFLAAANDKEISEMVDALVESQDKKLYDSIMEECYGDEKLAKRLFEVEKAQRQAKYESARQQETAAEQKAKEDLAKRLADDFVELQEEFPDITEFSGLPQQVVDTAVKKGISLTDAYLRHQHAENKKITAARTAQEQAAKVAAGPQSAGTGETADPVIEAMLAGVRGK